MRLDHEIGREVKERWRLRNGSFAIVGQRDGGICAGHIEGSDAIHVWVGGQTRAGSGYDLMELAEAERKS